MKKRELVALIQEAVLAGLEEAVYPEGFNVEEFKALPSFVARMKYVKARLPKIAQGSARAVFAIDDKTVLKVAMNKKGLAQNKIEAEIGRGSGYPVAEVFEVGDQGTWIEMEKATKATPKIFAQLAGVDINTFSEVIRFWSLDHRGMTKGYRKPDAYDDLVSSGDNDLINATLSLIGDYDMPSGDVGKISSWGVVSKGGQSELVLIDYGLTQGVWDDYYAPKRPPEHYYGY